ncbi:MAG: hypothetical protein IJS71_01525 [Clostridia bacterium]|nr:hypothetical protein [Clostridia bacterium]
MLGNQGNMILTIIMLVLGFLTAMGGTVMAALFLIPDKKRAKLKGFLKILADIATFRTLYIDKVIKILYVFSTLICICVGFFLLFTGTLFLPGLLLMLLGPVVVRIMYELLSMYVILVNNVVELNNKKKDENE